MPAWVSIPVVTRSSLPAAPPAAPLARFQHSVCRWCYGAFALEDLCAAAPGLGLASIELLKMTDFPLLARHGLTCALVDGVPGGIEHGLNRRENHDAIVAFMHEAIPATAAAGHPSIICFSGNRAGQSDTEGLAICAEGLARITPLAEQHGVTVVMELLNSRIDHPDYQCDRTAWGVALCEQVGSPRFKLLYDIYHMQIMEGDLIRTIQTHHRWIGHYHTGGNPGRHELDGTQQEIYYPAVMRAIAATGYTGFVGQEFIPTDAEPLAALGRAVQVCTVGQNSVEPRSAP